MNDVAVGGSYSPTADVIFNAEYHYHQAGFTRSQWHDFFTLGSASPLYADELWYIRAYANDWQEPTTQQEVFVRASWTNAFVKDLQLSAFSFINLYDGSVATQVSASYFLSDHWTVSGLFGANTGGSTSEHGSVPIALSGIARIMYYF
jgi:hypothetical protein